MKKLISITLTLVMLLMLTGCNIQSPNDFYSSTIQEKPNAVGAVTLSINCNVVKDKVSDPVILEATEFKINDGETVYDILLEATAKYNIKMVTDGDKGSEYIISINDVSQSDHGPLSGWLYYVNDEMAMVSMAQYKLKPNDKIEVLYSTNFGEDLK